jgi:hypothetical protein
MFFLSPSSLSFPSASGALLSDTRALFRCENPSSGCTTFLPPSTGVFLSWIGCGFHNLPPRDLHDHDGIADHIGGSLLALGPSTLSIGSHVC